MSSKGMYAIRHKYSKKWLYFTDFHYDPPRQNTSFFQAQLFSSREDAEFEFKRRFCNPTFFEVVKVRLDVIQEAYYPPVKARKDVK